MLAAGWFALHPVGFHVAAMSSAHPPLQPKPPVSEPSPDCSRTTPFAFHWQADAGVGPFTWVLLDAGYEELVRCDGLTDCTCVPDGEARSWLHQGGTFHWYVLATGPNGELASPLETVRID